jgi:transcriptional regulator with XRE-family HTH domain
MCDRCATPTSARTAAIPSLPLVDGFDAVTAESSSAVGVPATSTTLPGALVRKADPGQTKFDHFVREFGVEDLARRLSVDPTAIYHWLRGSTSPHPANAIKIQRLAKQRGIALSLDEIYQHFREVESERYKTSSLKPEPARD